MLTRSELEDLLPKLVLVSLSTFTSLPCSLHIMSVFVIVDDADQAVQLTPTVESAYQGTFNNNEIVSGWAAGATGSYLSF